MSEETKNEETLGAKEISEHLAKVREAFGTTDKEAIADATGRILEVADWIKGYDDRYKQVVDQRDNYFKIKEAMAAENSRLMRKRVVIDDALSQQEERERTKNTKTPLGDLLV